MKLLFTSILVLSVFLFSCGTETKPVYQLDLQVSPAEAGTITPSGGPFNEGEEVTLTAIPNDYWVFEKWAGDFTTSDNPFTFLMDADKSVMASFVKMKFPLNVQVKGRGSVTEQIVPQKARDYEHGTMVQLTPVPSEWYRFSEWSGDLSGSEDPGIITVNGEKNVLASFIPAGDLLRRDTYQYDSNNNPIERLFYDSDDNLIHITTWTYDSNNNLTVFATTDYSWNFELLYTYYFYDSNNILIEEITAGRRYIYFYDPDNILTEKLHYSSDGKYLGKTAYRFDDYNNLIEEIRYEEDGSVSYITTWSYDSSQNITEIVYNEQGILRTLRYKYDSNNNLTHFNFDGPGWKNDYSDEYRYDSNGNLVESLSYDYQGKIYYRRTHHYDADNHGIEEIHYINNAVAEIHTFNYDSSNNLTEAFRYEFYNYSPKKRPPEFERSASHFNESLYPFSDSLPQIHK